MNPLWEIGEQLMVERLHPVSITALQQHSWWIQLWLIIPSYYPAELRCHPVHVSVLQRTQQLLSSQRLRQLDLTGGVVCSAAGRCGVTCRVVALKHGFRVSKSIQRAGSPNPIDAIYDTHAHIRRLVQQDLCDLVNHVDNWTRYLSYI